MLNQISNQIMPIIVQMIVSILGVIISAIGVATVKFIIAKKEELILKLGQDKYNEIKAYAVDAWNFVEEYFRISGLSTPTINEKVVLFEKELLKKVPYLTQEELDSLRLSLAGEINKGKAALIAPIETSQLVTQQIETR